MNLKEIWEKKYRKLSFPDFKRRFHERDESITLNFLNDIDATFVVNFSCHQSLEHSLAQLLQKLQHISKFFSQHALTNKYFKMEQLAYSLQKSLKLDKYTATNLTQIILHSMVRYNSLNINNNAKRVIHFNELSGYQVNSSYEDFFKFVQKQSAVYLDKNIVDRQEDESYNIYLAKGIRNSMDRLSIVFGILEALNLVNYQIQGGNTPEIYIRINSTLQLESLINNPDNYQNKILNNVHYRHNLSIAMLKYIFESKMTTAQFWDVIENYFLGKIPEHVIDSLKKEKATE